MASWPLPAITTMSPGRASATAAEMAALRFRVEVACLGYQSLTDDDVPQDYIGSELDAYKEGAADAARAILSELNLVIPPGRSDA